MTLQLLHSEFPYTVYEENLVFFSVHLGTEMCQNSWKDLISQLAMIN